MGSSESSSHRIFIEIIRRDKRLRPGCLELESISNFTITHQTLIQGFPSTIFKGKLLYGGTN
jgi:hypothetical protein